MSRVTQDLLKQAREREQLDVNPIVLRGEPTKLDKKRRRNKRRKAGRHA